MLFDHPNEYRGSLYILFSALMYATLPILVKLAYSSGLTPGNALWLRYLCSTVILVVFIRLTQQGPVLSLSRPVVAQGTFLTIGGVFYFLSLQSLSAGLATIIFFTHPVLVACLSIVFLGDKFSPRLFGGLILALAGIALVSGWGYLSASLSSWGLMYAFLSCICYALYSLIGQKSLVRHDPLPITATLSLAAMIILAPIFYGDLQMLAQVTVSQILIALAMAILNTLLAVLFFLKGVQQIGAARATLLSTAEPVFCVVMAYFALGETLTGWQAVGAVMIFASMLLAVASRPSRVANI